MAHIDPVLLTDIIDAAQDLNPSDSMSPKVLRAMAEHVGSLDVLRSVETGAGGSSLLFSHLSAKHTAFVIEGSNRIITRLKSSRLLRSESTEFVEGPTQRTLPSRTFDEPLQAVLIDGPHAFPFPQLEYFHLYPHIATGGLLIVDDIHVRTIHELYRFLSADDMFDLVRVVERTAFFRRTAAPVFDPFGDGWWLQRYNRSRLLRYTWLEALKNSLPKGVRELLRESRSAIRRGLSPVVRYPVSFVVPLEDSTVDEQASIAGCAILPPGAHLYLLVRRSDLAGWWPQNSAPIVVRDNQWSHVCKFGGPADCGHTFEIAALAAGDRLHRRIQRWFEEGMQSGAWDPINLPEPAPGTGVAVRKVRKKATSEG